jgi:polyisoprenoid-binding protein YceI
MKLFHSVIMVTSLLSVPLCVLPASNVAAQSATPKAKAGATAAAWTIDARQSRIAFATRWAGQAVNGNFRQWSGDIKFDPANLAASKAIITIQTGSALTGMKEPDDNVTGSDWLDSRRFPTARYETTAIRSVGPNRYVADGLLTIKGVSYRLALPMTLKLGLESDSTAEWVARETVVNVAVRAARR